MVMSGKLGELGTSHTHTQTNVTQGTKAPKTKALQAGKPNHACENSQNSIISINLLKQTDG